MPWRTDPISAELKQDIEPSDTDPQCIHCRVSDDTFLDNIRLMFDAYFL